MNVSAINNNSGAASASAAGGGKNASGSDFASQLSAAMGGSPEAAAPDSPEAQLAAWAKMTPAQQMRASILAQMGLKESDLASMSPADRKAVEDKIQHIIQQQMQNAMEKGKISTAI